MIYKMADPLYFEVTKHLSPDGKGVHADSDWDLEDFAEIIKSKYGLMDLHTTDYPTEEDWDSPEYYHYQVVDEKLFNYFLLKWL